MQVRLLPALFRITVDDVSEGKIKKTYPVPDNKFESKEFNNHIELEYNLEQDEDYEGAHEIDMGETTPMREAPNMSEKTDELMKNIVTTNIKHAATIVISFVFGILFCLTCQYVIYGSG